MNIKSAATSIATFVIGVILFAILVSLSLGFFFGAAMRKPSTTIIVERPDSYKGWWGHYGAGLPGWGGGRVGPPPPPPPHPKPQPPGSKP